MRIQKDAIDFVRDFGETGRPLAAICHGPWTLINAGLVEGKQVTSWPSVRVDLENAGARWEDSEVVEDGNLITSRKPDDIPAFTGALIQALERSGPRATGSAPWSDMHEDRPPWCESAWLSGSCWHPRAQP